MITNKALFIIIVAVYFISDFFFNEAMLYIMGGGILGSLRELSDKTNSMLPSVLIWIGLLAVFIVLFCCLRSKPIKIFILLLIAALLYVVDFIRMELLPINVNTITARYFVIAISILSKSLLLYLIIYYDQNQRIITTKTQ
jgi:hypothetical protein